MKKIISLLLATFLLAGSAYAQNAIFKKYGESDGVTVVNISKSLLGLMKNKTGKDRALGEAASRLQSVKVLTCDNSKVSSKIQSDLMKIIKTGEYEEIISHVEGKEKSFILSKDLGHDNYEYVIIHLEKNQSNIVNIIGKLSLEEIQALGM